MRIRIVAVVMIFLILGVFLTRLPQTNAQFVIAGWDYPDEYGQGIGVLWGYTNDTGSWIKIREDASFSPHEDTTVSINYTEDTAFQFIVTCFINHSLFDFGPDPNENASALAITRVGVEFSSNTHGLLFSFENMTWYGTLFEYDDYIWSLSYEIVIDHIIQAGTIYTVRFYYEILWEG